MSQQPRWTISIGLVLAVLLVGTTHAQCILANPSFEFVGSGGTTFAGWYEFGVVGAENTAPHGLRAARVSGTGADSWDVSAFWQAFDASAGERWSASVNVWHSGVRPLTGQSKAILNVEWRNNVGHLIDYESHTIADVSTPSDDVEIVEVLSQPAPVGTTQIRILLGVLQEPGQPAPDVFYDQVSFVSFGALEESQWGDFVGGNTLQFAGRTWRVKGPGVFGPGPNYFRDSSNDAWIDAQGELHMTVQNDGGVQYATEIALDEALGYGDYVFTTRGRLDSWHPNVVLGLFLWQYGPCYDPANGWWNPYNEIDVEFSRWGDPQAEVGQFVTQPWDFPGNRQRFDATFEDDELTSHAFRWLPDRVEYRSWRGWADEEATSPRIAAWTYSGPHIPRPEQPRVHINFWQFDTPPGISYEVVVADFVFVSDCVAPQCDETVVAAPQVVSNAKLEPAQPNPFNPKTTIRYEVPRAAHTKLDILDLIGRRVRTLVDRHQAPGRYTVEWDGRDDDARRVASGVYTYRLRSGDFVGTNTMVLVK